jgi:phosphoribosylformimino-5-aminoimidazole carboxamide ribotide isomerase
MLIPSIDVMGGKIVQLVQGERKALESDDFDYWINRFAQYPLVQLIDLDAAMGKGDNRNLIAMICRRLPCQIGGGVRNIGRGQELLELGARRVILGSSLIKGGAIDTEFAEQCAASLGAERLTFAIDSRNGKVAIKGWKEATSIDPLAMVRLLDPFCGAFLYTHIDTEGTLTGFPLEIAERLQQATERKMIVAGGIRSMDEVTRLNEMNVDAVVGMAIYTKAIKA